MSALLSNLSNLVCLLFGRLGELVPGGSTDPRSGFRWNLKHCQQTGRFDWCLRLSGLERATVSVDKRGRTHRKEGMFRCGIRAAGFDARVYITSAANCAERWQARIACGARSFACSSGPP